MEVPPPPQVCGEVQVPHEETVREVPQLSLAVTEPQWSVGNVVDQGHGRTTIGRAGAYAGGASSSVMCAMASGTVKLPERAK